MSLRGNLDSSNTIDVMNIIKAISKQKLVILVTHERDIAEFYSDRVIEIVDGKIVMTGKTHMMESLITVWIARFSLRICLYRRSFQRVP